MSEPEVSIRLGDFGFLMGVTVVERLRTFGGELFRPTEHLARLRDSLLIMGWRSEELVAEVRDALGCFLERNHHLVADGDDWSVVVFITPGNSPTATEPTVCVHGFPLAFQNWAGQHATGIEAVTVDVRQVPANCWPAELKCRSRIHYYLADRQAEQRQPGARAIVLDQDGFIGEGSTANVVAYFADRGLVTPRRSKVLPGVTQEVVYQLAESLGIPHNEADISPAELAQADEIYFTSTSVCMLPVVRLDGQLVSLGKPGPKFQQLLNAYSEHVGVDIAQQAVRFSHRAEQ